MLSWQQIGSGAMLSRAVGGIARGKLVFAMPGSTKAVELAMTQADPAGAGTSASRTAKIG